MNARLEERDPELQNDELEFWLCSAESACGMRSSMGPMLDQLQAAAEVGLAANSDGNFQASEMIDDPHGPMGQTTPRYYRGGTDHRAASLNSGKFASESGLRATVTRVLAGDTNDIRPPSKHELATARLWQDFGVGVVAVGGRAHTTTSSVRNDPYDSGQCDFRDDTWFARARFLWKRWKRITPSSQKVLAAHYLGLNPETPEAERRALQRAFGLFAAVAYWTMDDAALAAVFDGTCDTARTKLVLESLVRSSHREWLHGGE